MMTSSRQARNPRCLPDRLARFGFIEAVRLTLVRRKKRIKPLHAHLRIHFTECFDIGGGRVQRLCEGSFN